MAVLGCDLCHNLQHHHGDIQMKDIIKAVRNRTLAQDAQAWAESRFRELYQVLTKIRGRNRILSSDSEDRILKVGHLRAYRDWDWYLIRVNVEGGTLVIRTEESRQVSGRLKNKRCLTLWSTSLLNRFVSRKSTLFERNVSCCLV
jgi:hypothetical protein